MARRAGIMQAAAATARRKPATHIKVSGSCGLTPKSRVAKPIRRCRISRWLGGFGGRQAGAQVVVDVELEVGFEFVGELAFVGVFVEYTGESRKPFL
jgi:hypothetical protein